MSEGYINKMSGKGSSFKSQNEALVGDYLSLTSRSDVEIQQTTTIKRYQKLVLALAVISILLCVVVLAIALFSIFQNSDFQGRRHEQIKPIACIECVKLVKDPYDLSAVDRLLDSLQHEYRNDVEHCCAYDSKQLSSLLELTMRRQVVNKSPLPSFNVSDFTFSPVSAHKRMYPPKNPFPEVPYRLRVPTFGNKTVHVLFQYKNISPDPLVEHTRGVEVLEDGLRILYSGLYYVYSSIHFRPESAYPCKNFTYQTWSHIVERMSPNNFAQTGCLLKTTHTCCDSCTMDEETSYTGGVFQLQAGDIIRVAIGGYGLVYFRETSSFAGLMMLGTGNTQTQEHVNE